jgi:hypothetical protein
MLSFDLVILTGLFGIFCYQVAPRLLTQIEGSPLLLDDLLKRRAELQQELAVLSQTGARHFDAVVKQEVKPQTVYARLSLPAVPETRAARSNVAPYQAHVCGGSGRRA